MPDKILHVRRSMNGRNFKKFASPYGGVYFPGHDDAIALRLQLECLEHYFSALQQQHNSAGTVLTMEFGYINSRVCNALASKTGGTYVAAVTKGLAEQLLNVFLGYLSHPNLLTDVGNAAVETVQFDWKVIDGVPHPTPNRSSRDNFVAPHDSERFKIALFLYNVSLSFAFLHECGHICCGHLDYLRANHSIKLIEEIVPTSDNELRRRIYPALEIDADMFAFSILYDQFKKGSDGLLNSNTHKALSLVDRLQLSMFSVGTVFRILQYNSKWIDPYHETRYPSPAVRFYSLTIGFLWRLVNEGELTELDYQSILITAIKRLTEVDALFNPGSKVDEWFKDSNGLILHAVGLGRVFDTVHEQLKPFEFVTARPSPYRIKPGP